MSDIADQIDRLVLGYMSPVQPAWIDSVLDALPKAAAANKNLRKALASVAYLDVTNLGSEAQSGRPARYFECKLCGDWNDEIQHIRHADGCPLG